MNPFETLRAHNPDHARIVAAAFAAAYQMDDVYAALRFQHIHTGVCCTPYLDGCYFRHGESVWDDVFEASFPQLREQADTFLLSR